MELDAGFFTIEPMINPGKSHVKILSDDWAAVTRDRSRRRSSRIWSV